MPYEDHNWNFDLGNVGFPEFTVACRDPQDMPAAETRRVAKATIILQRAQKRGELDPGDDWAIVAFDDFLKKIVVSWNVTPRDGTEVLPLTGDDPFGPLENSLYNGIMQEVAARLNAPPKSPRR